MIQSHCIKRSMIFHLPAGTSRGVLKSKDSWFIRIRDHQVQEKFGMGECSLIPGLSIDNRDDFEHKLREACAKFNTEGSIEEIDFSGYPAMAFGFETALRDFNSGGEGILYPSGFTKGEEGIAINGLIWMGDRQHMLEQVAKKIDAGFSILKFKVGAIDFNEEMEMLKAVRADFSSDILEIRLDANGAWSPHEAAEKLKRLAEYEIHSIEQVIAAGQMEEMANICEYSPIDIALDEELIGITGNSARTILLETIKPKYIILKPSLLGGMSESEEWISIAEKLHIGWWATSALESNIGLNAIAQWTATFPLTMPQGLGTGQLFTNNIASPLRMIGDQLFYLPEENWDMKPLLKAK